MTRESIRRGMIAAALSVASLVPGVSVWATSFEVSESLRVFRVLEGPAFSADGSMVAWVGADWQEQSAIRAHKGLGRLIVRQLAGEHDVTLSSRASDPVWSRSGHFIAFFEGLGDARELVAGDPRDFANTARRFSSEGGVSRYSAHHFRPLWSRNDRFLLVAEAKFEEASKPAGPTPYSVSTDDALTPFDTHFRDRTLWRLVRIELRSGAREILTPYGAIREMHASPTGDRVLLGLARSDMPGRFVGDVYKQQLEYRWLDVSGQSALRTVTIPAGHSVAGWADENRLLTRWPDGVATVDVESAESMPVLDHEFAGSTAGFAHRGTSFVAWGSDEDEEVEPWVVPPPLPHRVLAGDWQSGLVQEVVGTRAGQEILDALWLAPDRRLVLHSRSLDSLAERLLLWDGTSLSVLLETERAIGPITAASADWLAFSAERADQPPEVFGLRLADRQLVRWSRHNADFAHAGFVKPVLIEDESPGDVPRRALLYLPSKSSPGTGETPWVVSAYGRQTDQRHRFNPDAQMHVAQGYGYLIPDVYPRRGALRKAYLETLPSVLEQVRRRFPELGRTGYLGGSLGGYAGLVLLTHGDDFDAAVLRAAPAEFTLSWATGKDRDAELLEFLMLGRRPDQDRSAYQADSPLWQIDGIRTPVRLLHGSDDQQVPFEHSLWVFQSLRRLQRTAADLRIYPGADHSIVRGSRTYYLDYYEQIFSWWERHLRTPP